MLSISSQAVSWLLSVSLRAERWRLIQPIVALVLQFLILGLFKSDSHALRLLRANRSSRVVKDDAERVAVAGANATDAVPEIHAIHAPVPLYGAMMNCEHHTVPLPERDNYWSRLHTRPLLRHHEFAAREIFVGFGQQDGELERENMLPIKVLVQAVVIIHPILEQKRCRPALAGLVAPLNEVCVFLRVANINTHRAVPTISDRDKMRINGRPQARNKAGQRIAEEQQPVVAGTPILAFKLGPVEG